MFLDMDKAFDRCSWEFLQDALAAVGFGQDFIDYVLLAYSHTTPPTRQIYVNGFLGPSFPLGSGVAQGCPLSPLLFLIIAEPLTRLFNQNKNIYGIVLRPEIRPIAIKSPNSPTIAHLSSAPRTYKMP